MSDIQDFGSADPTEATVKFKVQGQEYEARKRTPFMRALELVDDATGSDDDGSQASRVAHGMKDYIQDRLLPESWERFETALASEDPATMIDASQVAQIYRWLIEQSSGRPTDTPGDSSE